MNSSRMAKSVHQKLLNLRDKTGEQFNHLLIRYGLERLLYRLVASGHDQQFVLKGAMLFSLWHDMPGRPTRDIDFLGLGEIDHDQLRCIFSEACTADVVEDGLRFDPDSIVTDDIRENQEYQGIRVRLNAYLGNARLPIQIDIGLGDAIIPAPLQMDYPTILDFPSPRIRVYHPATVVAEKFHAMIALGMMNSRLKDFYDVHVILFCMDVDDQELADAIEATFKRRKTELPHELPLVFSDEFVNDRDKESQWQVFLKRSLLSHYEKTFSQVVNDLQQRLWPIILSLHNS
jgi:predicted nucleotidyltransferase component of viral defense system